MNDKTSWDNVSEDYSQMISPFNNLAIKKAIELLPPHLVSGPILIPGVGPGYELEMLHKKYPEANFTAFDYSHEMVLLAQKRIDEKIKSNKIKIKQLDLMDLEENFSALTVSFFLTHVMPDQVLAAMKQLKSLKKEGTLAMVYVPPKQRPEGPLFSFFKATNKVLKTPANDWEINIKEEFEKLKVKDLELTDLMIEWSFRQVEDFRKMMETLPRIKVIKDKIAPELYEKIWTLYKKDTGLIYKDAMYRGNVSIRLLTCKK